MGLDVAELMIAVEEEFNVEIFEAEAQQVVTLTDLVDLLERQIVGSAVTEEQAQEFRAEGLRKARKILAEKTGVDPDSLAEDTKLETLFPLETRSELWKEIQNEFPNSPIPALENPIPWFLVAFFFCEFIVLVIACLCASRCVDAPIVAFSALAILLLSIVGMVVYGYRNHRADFPWNCSTVIGLARCIISDVIRLDSEGHAWTRPAIEKALRTMVAQQLGVKPEDIDSSARIDDLF